jgi:hypothetical protein
MRGLTAGDDMPDGPLASGVEPQMSTVQLVCDGSAGKGTTRVEAASTDDGVQPDPFDVHFAPTDAKHIVNGDFEWLKATRNLNLAA